MSTLSPHYFHTITLPRGNRYSRVLLVKTLETMSSKIVQASGLCTSGTRRLWSGRVSSSMRRLSPRVSAQAAVHSLSDLKDAPYYQQLHDACRAVRLASKLCQTVQSQLSASEKADKNDDSPVTVADYGAQAVVAWVLSRSEPSSRLSMVAEEDSASLTAPEGRAMLSRVTDLVNSVIVEEDPTAKLTPEELVALIDLGASPGGASGRHWVLDPIDGTRGFVGMRQYCVCLGMLQDGEVQLGVLGGPNLPQGEVRDDDGGSSVTSLVQGQGQGRALGCLFLAHRGFGAFSAPLGDTSAPLKRLVVQDVTDFSQAKLMESYESRHSSHDFAAAVAKEAGLTQPSLRMDSQVKYGLLSRSDATRVFMRFPPATYREKIWDHAAGFVVVEEAGGKVTDALGRRLDFSLGRYLDTMRLGIIAAPPTIHAALVRAVGVVQARDQQKS